MKSMGEEDFAVYKVIAIKVPQKQSKGKDERHSFDIQTEDCNKVRELSIPSSNQDLLCKSYL